MKVLKLGIPKGSLQQSTIELFAKSGWRVSVNSRSYFPDIDDPEITCSLCRAQEMSRYVEQGVLDAGITGKDWILENDSEVVTVTDLIYAKVSKRPTRWVLAVPAGSPIRRLEDLEGKKIATELVNFTRRYFKERNINVQVEFSWGATEAKVVQGLADARSRLRPGREKFYIKMFRYPVYGALARVFEAPIGGRAQRARAVRTNCGRIIKYIEIVGG